MSAGDRPDLPSLSSTADRAAERVARILTAAEESGKRMLEQTENRVRERIAEGDRAAENRLQAAEQEAQEIIAQARAEATKVVGDATGEALAVVARAQENADSVVGEAKADATTARKEAVDQAKELLYDARMTAADMRTEGLEIAANLREMGDSLRSNAERLLRDVQRIHSHLVARLDRMDAAVGEGSRAGSPGRDAGRLSSPRREPGLGANGEVLDVPEFIPPG